VFVTGCEDDTLFARVEEFEWNGALNAILTAVERRPPP
jgi:hypothetical protein